MRNGALWVTWLGAHEKGTLVRNDRSLSRCPCLARLPQQSMEAIAAAGPGVKRQGSRVTTVMMGGRSGRGANTRAGTTELFWR